MLVDNRLRASLHFHDFLHGFRTGIWTGTVTLELKIAQELARVYHDPLFLVFLDLQKAYDTLYRDRPIQTLEVYGAGNCMGRLLETFWDHQKVVPR